jgi:hypothetical protein
VVRLLRLLLLELPLAIRGAVWRVIVCLMGGRLGPGASIYGGARIFSAGGRTRIEIGPHLRLLRVAVVNAVLPDARIVIGKWVHIGAGSTVTRDIPPFAVAAGVPARVIRYRPDASQPGKDVS